jgi:hypothetical protein
LFFFLFPNETTHNSNFEQPKIVFKLWGKNKSCSKLDDLQLFQKDQSQNPNKFWNKDLKSVLKSKLYFGELFLEVYFGKTFKINFAPKCLRNLSKLFTLTNKHVKSITSLKLAFNC